MSRRTGASKDIEKFVRIARGQDWQVRVTGSDHLQFIPQTSHAPSSMAR